MYKLSVKLLVRFEYFLFLHSLSYFRELPLLTLFILIFQKQADC